jgi:beta-glucosidase-like glycosyl hydrolase
LNSTYTDLVKQTFDFPQKDFNLKDNYLQFNGVIMTDAIAAVANSALGTFVDSYRMFKAMVESGVNIMVIPFDYTKNAEDSIIQYYNESDYGMNKILDSLRFVNNINCK